MSLPLPHRASVASSRSSKPPSKKKESSATEGPSIFGLLASKRLARQFANRVAARRLMTGGALETKPQARENTYRMQPDNIPHENRLLYVLQSVLDDRMDKNFNYTPKRCNMLSKVISEEVKQNVKQLGYDRYKTVVLICMTQKDSQGMQMSSRCAWDTEVDRSASATWQNEHLICTATVFTVYAE